MGVRTTLVMAATMSDKGAVDGIRLRPEFDSKKGGRSQIERQLLDGLVEEEIASPTSSSAGQMPIRDPLRNPVVELAEIGLHRRRLKGNTQRLAMQAVFIEIHQHQPMRE